jgi:hypothetical protein
MTEDTELTRITMDIQEALAEVERMRRRLLCVTELTGAAVAVLTAIHRAGGWHVADPLHQERLRLALDALEGAVVAVIDGSGA